MERRERVMKALSFEETDRAPLDLAGMLSTGVSCFAYPALVAALGLPPRRPRVHDTGQMLALPEVDVLDALDCDVVTVHGALTNAFDQPKLWHPYDFNDRLKARVRKPKQFKAREDGTILQPKHKLRMPPGAYVFNAKHGGQPLELGRDLPLPDPRKIKRKLDKRRLRDKDIRKIAKVCRRAREATDRAILFNGPGAGIGIGAHRGIGVFPLVCLTEPDLVHEIHELANAHALEQIEALLSEVHSDIDIYMCAADDWGTQTHTIAAPRIFRDLFAPYYRRVTDAVHRLAPQTKTFLHSCGAIYDILDDVIEAGFDVLNPVQWTAGGRSFREWKDKCRGRLALWGGGVNTQATLPLGTPADVEREVTEIVSYLRGGGGFVFNAIHNILAEIPPENVIAMYRAAAIA